MGVSIFSYAGDVTIGLQVDAGLVPDPETIIAALGDELAALSAPRPRHHEPMRLRERPEGWSDPMIRGGR